MIIGFAKKFDLTGFGEDTYQHASLRRMNAMAYDARGQVYANTTFIIDPATGGVLRSRVSKTWYDDVGNVVKQASPDNLFSKRSYNTAGWVTASYTSYDATEADSVHGAALTVAGDTVMAQSIPLYDGAGRQIASASYRRNDNATGEGALTPSKARMGYSASWYDDLGRIEDQVSYGTNGPSHLTLKADGSGAVAAIPAGAPAPNSSDEYIVSHTGYDSAGRANEHVNNKGILRVTVFDEMGRREATIENYVDGVVAAAELSDTDRRVDWLYDESGRLATLRAHNAKGEGTAVEKQDTRYVYEDPVDGSRVTAIVYPDSTDELSPATAEEVGSGWSIVSGSDHESMAYDNLGRRTVFTDQRQVSHAYGFDPAGRLASDKLTLLASGVDGAVRALAWGYDLEGRVETVTSFDDVDLESATPLNQIRYEYDEWGVSKVAQGHGGEAIVDGSPTVSFGYDAPTGRPVRTTYPDGTHVDRVFGADGVEHALGRVHSLTDGSGGVYAEYGYFGAGSVHKVDHPAVSGGMSLTYGENGAYGGLDAFDRIADQRWARTDATNVVQASYAYDRNSNPVARTTTGLHRDAFGYDGLDRLGSFVRQSPDVNATSGGGLDMSGLPILPHANQDGAGGRPSVATYEDDGLTIAVSGNAWKSIEGNFSVTSRTVLRLRYRSTSVGEIQGVMFASGGSEIRSNRAIKFLGTQNWGQTPGEASYTGGGAWQTLEIPVGGLFEGVFDRLVFVNDDDASGAANGWYSAIELFETPASEPVPELSLGDVPAPLDLGTLTLEGDGSQDGAGGHPTLATVSADGLSVHLEGNVWKWAAYPLEITDV